MNDGPALPACREARSASPSIAPSRRGQRHGPSRSTMARTSCRVRSKTGPSRRICRVSGPTSVQRGSQTKVVLIDGHALIDLMMRYKVGVRVERTVEVLDIDQNYFSEE